MDPGPPKLPAIALGKLTVAGPRAADAIDRVVRKHFPQLRSCYDSARATKPSLAGRVTVKLVIGEEGNVYKGTYVDHNESTLSDASVESCLVSAFGSMEFASPTGGITSVSVPLDFSAH